MKICSKCGGDFDIEDFHKRKNGKPYPHCKECQRRYGRSHYARNKTAYIDKALKWNTAQKKRLQEHVGEYLRNHPCVDCGEPDIVVLQFDHVKGKKVLCVAALMSAFVSLDRVVAEIEKCEVRCANCHLRRTSKMGGFWKESVA